MGEKKAECGPHKDFVELTWNDTNLQTVCTASRLASLRSHRGVPKFAVMGMALRIEPSSLAVVGARWRAHLTRRTQVPEPAHD